MGILVDRIGARPVLIGGLAVLSGSVALMGLAPSYWVLLALATLAGFGNSVFHPADYSILGATVRPERLGRAFGIHTFAGHLGWSTTPPVLIFLTALWNWRVALVIIGLLGLLAALSLFLARNLFHDHRVERHRTETPTAPLRTRELVTSPPILLMFVFFMSAAGISIGLSGFMPTSLIALQGIDLAAANMVLSVFLISGAVGVLAGGMIADRLRRFDLVATVGFCGSAIGLCVVAFFALPLPGIVVALAISGFMIGAIAPSRDLMVRAITPPGASGKVFGFVSTGLDVGSATAPLLFGIFLDLGAPAWVFLGAAVLMIVSVGAALIAARLPGPRGARYRSQPVAG
jgi:predicted MFS family arabinose efflux permease